MQPSHRPIYTNGTTMYLIVYPFPTAESLPPLWRWEVRAADGQLARIGTAHTEEMAECAAEAHLDYLAPH